MIWKIIMVLAMFGIADSAEAAQQVRGHIRKDGTYVAPHIRSSPDNTRSNNYGTAPNINPYTGKLGRAKAGVVPSYGATTQKRKAP